MDGFLLLETAEQFLKLVFVMYLSNISDKCDNFLCVSTFVANSLFYSLIFQTGHRGVHPNNPPARGRARGPPGPEKNDRADANFDGSGFKNQVTVTYTTGVQQLHGLQENHQTFHKKSCYPLISCLRYNFFIFLMV